MKILDLLLIKMIALSFFILWSQKIFSLSPRNTAVVSTGTVEEQIKKNFPVTVFNPEQKWIQLRNKEKNNKKGTLIPSSQRRASLSICTVKRAKKPPKERMSFLTTKEAGSPEKTWADSQNKLDTLEETCRKIGEVFRENKKFQVVVQGDETATDKRLEKKREHTIVLRDIFQDRLRSKGEQERQHKLRSQRELNKKYEIAEKNRASKNLLIGVRENWPIKELEKLIKKGADVSFRDDLGRTALHWAALEARSELVELLLTHNSDPNATDFFGNTPLHLVVQYYVPRLKERRIVIEMLLKERVSIYTRNHNSQNVFDIAYNSQFQNFIRYSYLKNI